MSNCPDPQASNWVGTWTVNECGGGGHQGMKLILKLLGTNSFFGTYWLSTAVPPLTTANAQGSLVLSNKVTYGALEGNYSQPPGENPTTTGQTIFVIDLSGETATFFGPWDQDVAPGDDAGLGTWSGTYVSSSTTP